MLQFGLKVLGGCIVGFFVAHHPFNHLPEKALIPKQLHQRLHIFVGIFLISGPYTARNSLDELWSSPHKPEQQTILKHQKRIPPH